MPTTLPRYTCPLTQAKLLGGNYFLLTMIAPPDYKFKAGQHVSIFFRDEQGEFERYYSIANAPNPQRELQFCIVMVEERVTRILAALKVGNSLTISSARGAFQLNDPTKPTLLIAGGSGISPIRAFFQQLTSGFTSPAKNKLHLIYGCKQSQFIPGKEEFLEFGQKHPANLGLWITAQSGNEAEVLKGGILDHIEEAYVKGMDCYLCGPQAMLSAVTAKLRQIGVPEAQIFMERY